MSAISRRLFMGRAAVVATAAAVPVCAAVAQTSAADPMLDLIRQLHATEDEFSRTETDEDADPVWQRKIAIEDRMAVTPVSSLAGAAAVGALIARGRREFGDDCHGDQWELAMAESLSRFLDTLDAGAVS